MTATRQRAGAPRSPAEKRSGVPSRKGAPPPSRRWRPRLGDDDKPILPDELGRLKGHLARLADLERRRRGADGPRVRDEVLVDLIAGTGLRCAEAVRLRVRDLHLEGRAPYVRVVGGKMRARKAVDTIPIPWSIVAELRAFVRGRDRDGYVFRAARSDRQLNRKEAWHTIKRAMRRVGLRECLNVHSLRHFFITAVGRVPGATELQVARLARLRSPKLVARYFHPPEADRRRLANAIRLPRARRAAPR